MHWVFPWNGSWEQAGKLGWMEIIRGRAGVKKALGSAKQQAEVKDLSQSCWGRWGLFLISPQNGSQLCYFLIPHNRNQSQEKFKGFFSLVWKFLLIFQKNKTKKIQIFSTVMIIQKRMKQSLTSGTFLKLLPGMVWISLSAGLICCRVNPARKQE